MTRIERPNQDALADAIDIYRDTMRPYIVDTLGNLGIGSAEDLISQAQGPHSEWFWRELRRHGSVEAAIDIGDFPHIIRKFWEVMFRGVFKDDRNVWNALFLIANARNRVAHPDEQDLNNWYVCAHLFHIADVLGRIDALDQKREVEAIRDNLRTPQAPREPEQPPPAPVTVPPSSCPDPDAPPDSEFPETPVRELLPGRPASVRFLARQVRRLPARTGDDYLQTRLYDQTGEWVISRMFGAPEEVFDSIRDDMTVNVDGYCQNRDGQPVILIDSITAAETQWDPTAIPPTPRRPASAAPRCRTADIQPGDRVNCRFDTRHVRRLTAKNGNEFLQTRLYDESGQWVIARMFSAPEEVFDTIADEMNVDVVGYCQDFQGQRVIIIEDISVVSPNQDLSPDDLPF